MKKGDNVMSRGCIFHPNCIFIVLVIILLLVSGIWMVPRAKSVTDKKLTPKPTIISHEHFDANTIDCTMTNNGKIVDDKVTWSAGMEWPKGTGKPSLVMMQSTATPSTAS